MTATLEKARVSIGSGDDADEAANTIAAACFEWSSNSIDSDGNEHYLEEGEEAEFFQTHEEVEVDLSSLDGIGNELGLNTTLNGEVEGEWINGNTSTIRVTLRQIGFRRDGSQPTATYWVKSWGYV